MDDLRIHFRICQLIDPGSWAVLNHIECSVEWEVMGCRGSHLVVLCAVAWEGRGKNVVSKVRVCPGLAGLLAGSTQCVSFMRN